MPVAIAVIETELPFLLADHPELARRIHIRGGEREFRFYYRDPEPMLPVIVGDQVKLVRWGNRDRKVKLPFTAWTWKASVEDGKWSPYAAEPVDVVGSYGLEGGVWFRVKRGFRGLLVENENEVPHVYLICEPPTRYYAVMTRGKMMPVLIGEDAPDGQREVEL